MYSGDEYYGDDVTSPLERPRPARYCVVYRTGGTANFKWHRTLAMTRTEAERAKLDTERMGYKAMVANYARSMAIGLPETYEV